MKKSIKIWLTISASAAFGAALGILFAPSNSNAKSAKKIDVREEPQNEKEAKHLA